MLENKIEQNFKNYCMEKDVLCLKMNIAGDNGYPDRLIIGKGFMFFIEFKRPNSYPSPLQILTHTKLRESGQDVYCFNRNGHAQLALDIYLCGISPEYTLDDKGITTMYCESMTELTKVNA